MRRYIHQLLPRRIGLPRWGGNRVNPYLNLYLSRSIVNLPDEALRVIERVDEHCAWNEMKSIFISRYIDIYIYLYRSIYR